MSKDDGGKYYVDRADYDEFLTLFHEHHFTKKRTSSLLEKHGLYSPILIDLDFRYASSDAKREFTKENIFSFIQSYAKCFFRFIEVGAPIRFFVQLKPEPKVIDGVKKDGIHIVCPDVTLDYSVLYALRSYALEQNIVGSCFEGLANDAADVFDISVIKRNNWFLYGATKPDAAAYRVAHCFTATKEGIKETGWVETDLELLRLFSIRLGHETLTPITFCLEEELRMWESIADPKKGGGVKAEKSEKSVSLLSDVSGKSDRISKILNFDGVWEISEMDAGFRLVNNMTKCLVAGTDHTKSGHSCVYVQKTHATFFCFSHSSKKVAKPTSMALWNLLSGNELEDELIDDVYACRKFVELMDGEIKKDGDEVYVFSPENGMWETGETALIAAVHRKKEGLVFTFFGEGGKKTRLNYGGETRNIRNMLVHLKAILPSEPFLQKVEESLPYLLFADGIFHIPTKKFTAGFDKNLVFLANIKRKFPVLRNELLEAEVNSTLFVLPFTNAKVGEYLKMRIARSIAGLYRDKKFICALGEADSSKGTLTIALGKAFGGYVTEWNANNLKYCPNSGQDEAKKLAWIFILVVVRLAISNESRMDKTPMDGNLIKTLASGGDKMRGRLNFKDEIEVVIRASFFYLGNDMPEITPNDSGIQTRVRMIRYTKRFVECPSGPNQLQADPTVKSKVLTNEWADALFWLIMDAFDLPTEEPAEVLEETKEWVPAESTKFKDLLEQSFTIDVSDFSDLNFTSSRDIISYVKGQNLNWSDQKIGRELAKLELIKDVKKIDRKSVNIWKGIKML
jgi:hypothetical protein